MRTGRPKLAFCKHGHESARVGRTRTNECLACRQKRKQEFVVKNPLYHRDKTRRWIAAHPVRYRWSYYRTNARRAGCVFELPFALFSDLITDYCFYCGTASAPVHGLDKVDRTKGYIAGNVVTSCWTCNELKGTIGLNMFIDACRNITLHQAKFTEKVVK